MKSNLHLGKFGCQEKHDGIKRSHFHPKYTNIFLTLGCIMVVTHVNVIPEFDYDQMNASNRNLLLKSSKILIGSETEKKNGKLK